MSPAGHPRLLLVGMGVMGRPYVPRARARGFVLSVVDNPANLADPQVLADWQPGDHTEAVDGAGDEAWYAAVSAAAAGHRPDAVVAFSEPHVMAAAYLADELGLPAPGLRAASLSRNKHLQRETFARYGIRQPRHRLATDAETVLSWTGGDFPVVLKPLSQAGSLGVRVVHDDAEVKQWLAEGHATGAFLCEEYCDGPEYSCEVLVQHGRVVFANVTGKTTTPPPMCIEIGHRTPAGCDAGTAAAIIDQAAAVVAAIGMRAGLAHVEVRVRPDGPYVMEVGVRTPGDFIMEMTELATGVDLFDAVVAIAGDQEAPVSRTREAAAGVWYPIFEPGTPVPVEALRAVAAMPGVVRTDINLADAWMATAVTWSLNRPGGFLLAAQTVAELDALTARVRARVDRAAS